MNTDDIKRKMKRKKKSIIRTEDYLSTGSTLLNLACTGRTIGGFIKGKYYFLVGDSASGKTWLSLTCLAEANLNSHFDGYRFIYDNAEDGALMDVGKYFGIAHRIEPPATEDKEPIYSSSIEEFYYHVDDAIEDGRPFIYILDSMDSLTSDAEVEKFSEQKDAHRKGKETAGSYGDGKAKKNSGNLRRLMAKLRETGSILIIISQTRDNLGIGFEKKTRSGGKALRFYATLELWSSIKEKLKKNVNGKPRKIGIVAEVAIKKNRITGGEWTVQIPIYIKSGFDDVGACVDYLVNEKQWSQSGNSINATDLDFRGTREKLIGYIENECLESDVRRAVGKLWREIEEACSVKRKNRYG